MSNVSRWVETKVVMSMSKFNVFSSRCQLCVIRVKTTAVNLIVGQMDEEPEACNKYATSGSLTFDFRLRLLIFRHGWTAFQWKEHAFSALDVANDSKSGGSFSDIRRPLSSIVMATKVSIDVNHLPLKLTGRSSRNRTLSKSRTIPWFLS